MENVVDRASADLPTPRRARSRVMVQHVRAALAERAGMRMESVSGRVDWERYLVEAAPFQEHAARTLGSGLAAYAALHDTVAGARVAICNARDWGEREFLETVALHGYGDSRAVSRLDLRVFASQEGLQLLLSPTGIVDGTAATSILASVLLRRRSGVLVLEHFDRASEQVRSVLSDGVISGSVTDYRGRELRLRSFTTVLMLSSAGPSHIGLRPATASHEALSADADVAVTLASPTIASGGGAILDRLLAEMSQEMGLRLRFASEARLFLLQVPPDGGLRAYRARVRRLLSEALVNMSSTNRRSAVTICTKAGRLSAF